jgi:hypothetical protein
MSLIWNGKGEIASRVTGRAAYCRAVTIGLIDWMRDGWSSAGVACGCGMTGRRQKHRTLGAEALYECASGGACLARIQLWRDLPA